jgi:phage tail-like protein
MRTNVPELLGTSHFRVLIGRREFGFAEISRLGSETDPMLPSEQHSLRFESVVLRRALTTSTDLFDWRKRIESGKDDRRQVTIQQLASAGGEVVNAWQLVRAWPCRWSGPAFDAAASGIAMEEIELAYDDLVWLEAATATPPEPSRARERK